MLVTETNNNNKAFVNNKVCLLFAITVIKKYYSIQIISHFNRYILLHHLHHCSAILISIQRYSTIRPDVAMLQAENFRMAQTLTACESCQSVDDFFPGNVVNNVFYESVSVLCEIIIFVCFDIRERSADLARTSTTQLHDVKFKAVNFMAKKF